MIIGDMEIRLRADIARLQRDMDSARQVVGNATAGMERAAYAAKAAIASIAAGLGVQELGRMVDEYAKFTAQLKLASSSQREYAAAYADVKRISTVAAQGLQETGVLYARIANGTRELGVAQKQVAAITETVNLSLIVSGASASEAASAQLQLSQAFASGTLRGEEFNAVNEAAPRLMLALADGIGVPVGALKKMAEEGQITSKIMADVLPNALVRLREEAKEVQTISGAFTVLRNNMMEFVGVQANASGVVSALTQAITGLSDNLATVGTALVAITAIKLAFWMDAVATKTLAASIASTTHRNATAASAQATVASTAAEVRNLQARAAMIVELRGETMATLAVTNAVINSTASDAAKTLAMQSRAVASAELAALGRAQVTVDAALVTSTGAAAAATTALTATTWRAAIAARALAAATWAIVNPLASITLALGIGATAWMWWSNRAQEANDKVAASTDETTTEMIGRLDKQIEKLKERNKLQSEEPRVQKLGQLSDADEQGLARAKAALDAVRSGSGQWANEPLFKRQLAEIDLANEYETALLRLKQAQDEVGAAATRTRDARIGEWYAQNGNNAQKLAAELEKLRQQFGTIPPEMEKMVRAKYADKGTAQVIKQEATAYQNLTTSIREKFAANELELNGYDQLSESQKMTIKLDEAIATGKNKLTPAHVAETRALIAKVAAQEESIEQGKFYREQAEQQAQLSAAAIKAADDEADRNEELARTFGKSKVAIEQMTLARLEEKLAQADTSKGYTREIAELEAVIDAKKRSIAAVGELEGLEALQKATEKARADQVQLWDSIEKTAHDTFISIFDSGKSAFDRLKDALKNGLYELLYQMTVKKWIVNISSQTSSGGGIAQLGDAFSGSSGGSSMFSNASSLINMGKTIYSGFTGGIAGTLGGWASSAGSMFGSTAVSSFGAGLSAAGGNTGMAAMYAWASTSGNVAAGASAGMSAGTYAIPIAGWIAAGMALSNSLYKKGWDTHNGTVKDPLQLGGGIRLLDNGLRGLGLSNTAANIFSGQATFARLFGRKNPEIESQGIQGNVSASGFDGSNYANILEKGGLFRSDKRYTKDVALTADQDGGFDATVKAMMEAAKGFAATLGIEATVIDGYNKSIKVQLGADEAKNQEAITKMFGEVGDELSTRLLPSLSSFSVAGETASATLQRLVSDYATVDEALTAIGTAFGAVGVSSLGARERLIDAAGGMEAFATNTALFHQTFLSEVERNAPVLKAVTEQMAALGHAGVDTRDEFKKVVLDLVNSGALTTEAGAKQYAALMKVQAGFAQVYPVIDETADAATKAAAALQTSNSLLELQAQIYELTGDRAGAAAVQAQQHASALAALDPALCGATQQLWDLQAAADAAAAAAAVAEQVKANAVSLMGNVDSAFSVMQRVADRQKRALQEEITVRTESVKRIESLSQALRGTLDGMSATGFEADDRKSAQAQIQSALAIAKASGVLPDADSLKGALSVLGKDSASQFATQQEYLRDFYTTRLGIEDLAGLTDDALSVEERGLQKLEDQVKQYDRMLEHAQEQIDIAKGQSITGLSIEQTLQAVLGALLAAGANPVNSANAAISDAYKSALGRAPDAGGLDFWQDKAAGGLSTGAIVDAIKNSPEAQIQKLYKDVFGRPADAGGLQFWLKQFGAGMSAGDIRTAMLSTDEAKKAKSVPGYAAGGDFAGGWRLVGENGPELEATGPARIFNSGQTRDLMSRLANPADNSAALAAAVDRLSATAERQARTIAGLQSALDKNEQNTRRIADGLEVVTDGFKSMRTKEQTA